MGASLVTGGAGFIGSHLVERLLSLSQDVVVIDDLSSGTLANLPRGEPGPRVIVDDIRNVGAHSHELLGVNKIYHLAALISGHDSLHEPEKYVDVNMKGLLRLILAFRDTPNLRIIFSSSSTIYGNTCEHGCHESDPASPLTVYALTKLACEHMLAMYASLFGFEYVALRLFNVYGPRQRPDHPYANVTCKFAYGAATGKPVQLVGDGCNTRDFIYVDDVVDAMIEVSNQSLFPLYNIGTGVETSIRRLLEITEKLAGVQLQVQQTPPWPNDIQSIQAKTERYSSEFKSSYLSLTDGLDRTIQSFRTG